MKRLAYVILIAAAGSSCKTSQVAYDDVYESVIAPQKINESDGYKDYIKEGQDEHKVVIDDQKNTSFGGYYNNSQASVAPFGSSGNGGDCHDTQVCCDRSMYYNDRANQFSSMGFFGSCFNRPYSLNRPLYNCSCPCCSEANYYNQFDYWHYSNLASVGALYGYYDYWGGWHSYYPYGYDPYGYMGYGNYFSWNNPYYYGNGWNNGMNGYWYNGTWYGNGWYGNGWNNNGNNNGGNGGGVVVSNPSISGNHLYGHRGMTTTGSANTTSYAHTVKGAATDGDPTSTGKPILVSGTPFALSGATTGTIDVAGASSQITGGTEKVKPVSTSSFGTTATTQNGTNDQTDQSFTVDNNSHAGVSTENRVVAGNQFASKYDTGSGARTNGSGGTYAVDPQQQNYDNSAYSSGKYTHVVTTTTSGSEGSTSRSTSGQRTNSETNTWTNSNSRESSGNTTTGHRTTTTSSGSTTGNTGGGSRTTSSSRR